MMLLKKPEAAALVMAPKVKGTLVLDKLLGDTNLDFCVLCSSVASIYGDFAQVDYSAANAFLDAYAQKHAAARKIVSIDWNMWRDVGMGVHNPVPARLQKRRERELSFGIAPEEGKEAFARILAGSLPRVLVSPRELDINGYKEQVTDSEEPVAKVFPDKRRRPRPNLSTEYVIPGNSTERTIAEVWQELLGVETVGIHDNFFELGGNSSLLPGVVSRIRSAFAVTLPGSGVVENPTVHLLSEGIRQGKWDSPLSAASRSRGQKQAVNKAQEPERWSGSEIAIIGMAGRFPGASNLEKFWSNLRDGVESITFFTDAELLASGVDPAVLRNPSYIKAGYILDAVDQFDAPFFGFSPRLAAGTDPQRRLFLECAWEAIEAAGYDAERYEGAISVFAGATMSSYLFNNLCANPEAMAGDSFLLNQPDSIATLVGFKLNLKGACYNVGTFCSTSLVAVHLACQSLLNFECDIAVAGGVHAHSPHKAGYFYEEGAVYSPDGHCRPFDAKAQGVVFGNGAGAVVLKRLKDALADGDSIDAVILGSATNNDGSDKVSFFAPSVIGQAEVIIEALAAAGVEPDTISYVEAHGTGTAFGDPVEVAALNRAFRSGTREKRTCALGSLKGNISHVDAAAGVCGLIKAALALKNRQIPATVNFHEPNPNIDFENGPFYVNSTLLDWRSDGAPRRAGVSAFGFGGTNAHVIVQEAPVPEPSGPSRPHQLLVLSAKTASALEAATGNMIAFLKNHPEVNLADAAYTLKVGRAAFNHRRVVVCRNNEDAVAALEAADSTRRATAYQDKRDPGITFMFSGQGAQYAGMGAELYRTERVFRESVDQCSEILRPHLGLDIRKFLFPAPGEAEAATEKLTETAITQPALFVVEYSLAQLWMSWGVHPTDMVGHSIGEYVAACLAGVYSLEDALLLVAARGRLMQSLPGGSMLAVRLREAEIRPLTDDAELCLAAVNSPSLCTVSGSDTAIDGLKQRLTQMGADYRPLHTSHAFHSSMMDPILDEFASKVSSTKRNSPHIPFLSNLSGTWIAPEQAMTPEYWTKHLRHTVRFSDGVQELLKESNRVFLEVGPGNTLSTLVRQHLNGTGPSRVVLGSLRHPHEQQPDDAFILNSLGRLWLAGVDVNWPGFYEGETRRRIVLPTYPFERRRYWVDPTLPPQGMWAMRAGLTRNPQLLPRAAQSAAAEQALAPQNPEAQGDSVAAGARTEDVLTRIWCKVLGSREIGPNDDFFELGGDSFTAIQLFSEINRVTGKNLPLATLFEAPTIEKLAAVLGRESEGSSSGWSSLVPIQTGGTQPPLFLVHGAEGNILLYRQLVERLGPDQPVYGFQARGLDGAESFHTKVEEMAADYIRQLSAVQPHGPYRLGGYCLGGVVALEMADQLKASGEQVSLVALIESYNLNVVNRKGLMRELRRLPGVYLLQDLWFHAANVFFAANKSRWKFFREKWNIEMARADVRFRALYHSMKSKNGAGAESKYPHLIAKKINDRAAVEYVPKPYSGRVAVFKPKLNFWGMNDSTFGWGKVIRDGMEVHEMPIYPKGMLVEPFVQNLATELQACLK
jgi:acyl transferase domain-containing protein/thioesterase domain-containing protein